MSIKRIEDFIAWQRARELERRVFAFTGRPPANRDRAFCDQIRRSSSSAPRNMAEGFGRFWPAEFAHKLHIAVGELRETQDHLEQALEQRYVNDNDQLEMFGLADASIGASVKFIEYLEASGTDWKKQFLQRRREAYRAQRRAPPTDPSGTTDPQTRQAKPLTASVPPKRPPGSRARNPNPNPNPNEHPNENPNSNENENENENPEQEP